jgi:hypothetical protein
MTSISTTTTDHDEIRRWVSDHNGTPAIAVLYQQQKASGEDSTFFKLVNRK